MPMTYLEGMSEENLEFSLGYFVWSLLYITGLLTGLDFMLKCDKNIAFLTPDTHDACSVKRRLIIYIGK